MEYQRAESMSALPNFVSDLEGSNETCTDMMADAKHLYSMFQKEKHFYRLLAVRDFTMLCNNAE